MVTQNNRDSVIDLIRVIALFLVIVVHTHVGQLSLQSLNDLASLSMFFLGKLGVPLFVMISGALLLDKQEQVSNFYSKRIKKILIPWFFWAAVLLYYKVIIGSFADVTIINLVKELLVVMLSDFWFIPMIIGVYFLKPYLQTIVQTFKLHLLLIVWFILVSVLPFVYLSPLFPNSASAGLLTLCISFCGYFLLGWFLRNQNKKVAAIHLIFWFVLSLGIYLLSAYLYQGDNNKLFFVLQDYFSPAIVMGSSTVFLLLYSITPQQLSSFFKRFLQKMSTISYGIFLSHVFVLLLINQFLPVWLEQNTDLLSWLIRAILLYSSSALIIFALHQIPIIKRFIS